MIQCLHGAVGSHHNWHHIQSALPGHVHPVDLWRLIDHDSPTLPEAGRIIASQAAPNDILLGYSMGGRLALHALLAEPQQWRAAIIISAHPGLTKDHAERLAADQKWAQLAQDDWPEFLTRWNKQAILSDTPDSLQLASPADAPAVSQSFRFWSLGAQRDLRPQLPAITCPVLWLTGENDPKFTQLGAEASALIPGARHQILPACGHRLPWEKPDLFLNAVEKFLAITRKETILDQ